MSNNQINTILSLIPDTTVSSWSFPAWHTVPEVVDNPEFLWVLLLLLGQRQHLNHLLFRRVNTLDSARVHSVGLLQLRPELQQNRKRRARVAAARSGVGAFAGDCQAVQSPVR